jgi:nitroreductase
VENCEWIYQRRSIRKFTSEPIEDKQLEELLRAGMAAPTAMNLQPWLFVVVKDEIRLAKIRSTLAFGKMNALCAISVCGNLQKSRNLVERFWVQDCSAATENILLAATSLGLGAVWCGVHPIHFYVPKIASILELPEGIIPLNVIFVGNPAETKPARTQYDARKVFLDRYGQPWEQL